MTSVGNVSGGTGLIAANQMVSRIYSPDVGNQIAPIKVAFLTSTKFTADVKRFAQIRIKGVCVRRQIFGIAGTPD